jgi:hypothetical protein
LGITRGIHALLIGRQAAGVPYPRKKGMFFNMSGVVKGCRLSWGPFGHGVTPHDAGTRHSDQETWQGP